jgi:integrase
MSSYLRLRGSIYWFRRRVPPELMIRLDRLEIHRTLRTSSSKVAAKRGRRAWLATERAFDEMARNPALAAKQARLLIEQLLEESIFDSPTADDLIASAASDDSTLARMLFNRDVVAIVAELPPEQRERVHLHMDRIMDKAELAVARRWRDWEALKAQAALLQANNAQTEADAATMRAGEAERMLSETRVAQRVAEELRAIAGRSDPVAAEPVAEPHIGKAKAGKPKPLWSAVAVAFIAEKSRPVAGHRSYDQQTIRQTESTMALWTDIIGDRRMSEYDGSDANLFRDTMLRMPSSHGKSGTRLANRMLVQPLEAIRIADQKQKLIDAKNALLKPGDAKFESIPRLQMKTLKRHFSTLSQFWIHAQRSDYVARDVNPFRGWDYQGVVRGAATRSEWSTEDLNKLLRSRWFAPQNAGTDDWWVTLIAIFSGMRVEEIVRLRAAYDVVIQNGVPCFKIQVHDDGWQPKTPASIRDVPIHSNLLELGLMQKLAEQQAAGERYLFSSFTGRPSSDKRSAKFVSDFSRHKTRIGIDGDTTFHSFRHSVVTILRNTPLAAARESWIDAVLGHEGAPEEGDNQGTRRPRPKRSEGQTTYLGAIALENLVATVEAIRYPAEVDFSRVLSI